MTNSEMKENKKEDMNIVFSSDDNYAQLMGVAICSIFENKKPGYILNIYVLDGGISKREIRRLNKLEKKYNFKINYIKIDTSFFKDFYTTKVPSQATYYRIMIPMLVPHFKKVLYLDCDIVVIDDIYELYDTDISNHLFAATEDMYLGKTRHKDLNIPLKEKYFNCGVLLINIEKCNDIDTTETMLKFINNNPEKLEYADQDAFNATMWGKFLCLDKKYNYFPYFLENIHTNKFETKKNIKIIHYAGKKPSYYFKKNILAEEYFYYLNKTPWRNLRYIDKYKARKNRFFINLSLYFENKLPSLLSRKNIEKIRKIKRKLNIKFY